MKFRRILTTLLCIITAIGMLPASAFCASSEDIELNAATDVTITADTSSVGQLKPGDSFTVSFVASGNNRGLSSGGIKVLVPEGFTVTALKKGAIMQGLYVGTEATSTCAFASANPIKGDGELFTATISVGKDVAAGTYTINSCIKSDSKSTENLIYSDNNNHTVLSPAFASGTVTVVSSGSSDSGKTDGGGSGGGGGGGSTDGGSGGGSGGGGGGGDTDGDSTASSYSITLPKTVSNGSVTSTESSAAEGTVVTLKVNAADGYKLQTLTVKSKDGKTLELMTIKEGSEYGFIMPASDVTIEASFEVSSDQDQQSNPFVDVAKGAYYYDAVQWAFNNKIATGTDASHFSPNGITTRAQAVTFLWRTDGEKVVSNDIPFTDVSANAYYLNAVKWASANNITTGTTATTFGPNSEVNRAQLVTFLWRMAGSPEVSSASGTALKNFDDVSADDYYYKAVRWAVSSGITTGMTETTFAPNNKCTRAQVATFIYRYKTGN